MKSFLGPAGNVDYSLKAVGNEILSKTSLVLEDSEDVK